MTKPHLCWLPLVLLITAVAAAADKPTFTRAGHTTDSVAKVKKQIAEKKAVLLDVREESEWNDGHLKDAKLLPLSIIQKGPLTADQKKRLSKDQPVYCHCGSGSRVLTVARILRAKGYDIRPLKAGFSDLVKAGFKQAE